MRIDLEEREWVQVIDLLGEFKYKQVAMVISKIGAQMQQRPEQQWRDMAAGQNAQKFAPEPLVPRNPDGKFD